ncbi:MULTISPECIES: hypothetical protein [Delftia]|uniref:hypothetical protein n=1 Tax=Delftia TaxID=80865 RepID=UPI000F84161D|nr:MULTISPECIES: hypothetical protein [Delftia]KAA9181986.1 hypothetical protein F3K36_00085 [Delftia sp. BR1]WEL96965.1 hypothetical protein PW274_23255 [Delftia tsuruhatensis]WQM84899.1 hypothetical protein RNT40_08610 [Delftia tsuruhatensis]
MNATAKTRARKAPAVARPTFEQMMALALAKAEDDLDRLVRTRCADEYWKDVDADIDYAVELALGHIRSMKARNFEDAAEFCLTWGHAGAAINLAAKAFSRTDCAYGRFLRDAVHMFAQVAELVEFSC